MNIRHGLFLFAVLLAAFGGACRFSTSDSPLEAASPIPVGSTPSANSPFPAAFTPHTVMVGDPAVNYANVEFTAAGQFMVWFEMTDQQGNGIVWHCGVDPQTGDLIPADGKGFRAFESTIYGRANPGLDADGAYYVGADRAGNLLLVRPTSPTSGEIQSLPTPPDVLRRAIYPTVLPGQVGGYVFWIRDENAPGATNPQNDWVELHYISLENPTEVHVVERQTRPLRTGFAPMDSGFARWMRGKPALTYGFAAQDGTVQVRMLDLTLPNPVPQAVTDDPGSKIDPYGWFWNGQEILISGIDARARLHVYTRAPGDPRFSLAESIVPPASGLSRPALAQSAEPMLFGGQAYIAYQINEAGRSFWDVTFGKPGEIWLSTLRQSPGQQWLLTDSLAAKAEPEPFAGQTQVWVFYNVAEGSSPMQAVWRLYRAETPLREEEQWSTQRFLFFPLYSY